MVKSKLTSHAISWQTNLACACKRRQPLTAGAWAREEPRVRRGLAAVSGHVKLRCVGEVQRNHLVRGYFCRRGVGVLSTRDACPCHKIGRIVRVLKAEISWKKDSPDDFVSATRCDVRTGAGSQFCHHRPVPSAPSPLPAPRSPVPSRPTMHRLLP